MSRTDDRRPEDRTALTSALQALRDYFDTVPDDEVPCTGTTLTLAGDIDHAWRECDRPTRLRIAAAIDEQIRFPK